MPRAAGLLRMPKKKKSMKKKAGAMPKQPAQAKRAKTTAATSTAAAAAGGDDDDDETFNTLAKQVASTHLAQQDDCMQGTKENQSAYVAAVAQVTQFIARKLKLRPHDIREQVKEIFMPSEKSVELTEQQKEKLRAELTLKYTELINKIKRNGPGIDGVDVVVKHIATIESILGYALPGSLTSIIMGVKSWTPVDADPKAHLETLGEPVSPLPPLAALPLLSVTAAVHHAWLKALPSSDVALVPAGASQNNTKPPEHQHTLWQSLEAAGLDAGELLSWIDVTSMIQEGAASREEPLLKIQEECAKRTAPILAAATDVFTALAVDGATNNKILAAALGMKMRSSCGISAPLLLSGLAQIEIHHPFLPAALRRADALPNVELIEIEDKFDWSEILQTSTIGSTIGGLTDKKMSVLVVTNEDGSLASLALCAQRRSRAPRDL